MYGLSYVRSTLRSTPSGCVGLGRGRGYARVTVEQSRDLLDCADKRLHTACQNQNMQFQWPEN